MKKGRLVIGTFVLSASIALGGLGIRFMQQDGDGEEIAVEIGTPDLVSGMEVWKGETGREEAEAPNVKEHTAFTKNLTKREAKEQEIYSFLQGPKSWKKKVDWSGKWTKMSINGNTFGGFGCGLCCIANVYSTLSPYEASPIDAFQFAKKNSEYAPSGVSGAISWEDMKKTLNKMGVESSLGFKPKTYKTFRKNLKRAKAAIVLVCSYNDDALWDNTLGHYVSLWLYQDKDGTAFLADPGSPDRNRSTISTKLAYRALKTASPYQVLYIWGYNSEKDQWKHGGKVREKWVRPDYI